jgi:hypothetical protein
MKTNTDPRPPLDGPVVDLYDWHLARSLADGIDIFDAEILAESYALRVAR